MRVWICAWILALPWITPQLWAQGTASLPRTADGKLDLNGIGQATNTADWDLETRGSTPGPVSSLGAIGGSSRRGCSRRRHDSLSPGCPERRKENYQRRWTDYPEILKQASRIPRCSRGHGRSAFLPIAMSKRTRFNVIPVHPVCRRRAFRDT